MFDDMPQCIRDRMDELERIDRRDRADGTPRLERLRQITPDTGKFIALLAAAVPAGRHLEIGTSAGYSTLWLALACRGTGRRVTTYEILEEKVALARQTFAVAGVEDIVDLVHADAREHLRGAGDVSFCFLDAEKEMYADCYEAVVPLMVHGGILVADNALSHEDALRPMIRRAFTDGRVDALVVPVGRGELVCRRK